MMDLKITQTAAAPAARHAQTDTTARGANTAPPSDFAQQLKKQTDQQAAVWEDAVKKADDACSTEESEVKSLAEMMKEAKERAEEQRERFKLPNNTRYGDMPMEAYSRLSRARTQAQASAAAGYARRQIARCQAALRQDPDNAARIRATISSLQKAANRAGKKKREIQQDELTEMQRKKAAARKEKRKALHLRRELCRRKSMRSIRESGYFRECDIENRLQDQLQQTRTELQLQMQQLCSEVGGSISPEAAAQQYTAQLAAGSSGVSAPAAGVNIEA